MSAAPADRRCADCGVAIPTRPDAPPPHVQEQLVQIITERLRRERPGRAVRFVPVCDACQPKGQA